MNVQQGSQRAVVDWNTFNVGSQAQVNFVQPGASAAILNRVLDSRPSEIFGRITSNGQVFLTNASGIYFGPNSSVDVGALVASTHSMSTQDFMDGRLRLERNGSTGSVVNSGRLNALVREELGGYIALLAPEVRNEGVIIARLGTVALAAGETITLDIAGSHTLASLTVTPSQIRALVENKNLVQAPGGLIVLSAQAASALQGGVVSNSGRLEATGLAMRGGRIVLEASDRIENTGVIDASASGVGPAGVVSLAAPIIANSGQVKVDAILAEQSAGKVDIVARQFVQGATGSISAAAVVPLGSGRGGRVGIVASESVELGGLVRVSAGDVSIPVASDPGPSAAANGDGGEISILAGTTLRVQSAVLDASGVGGGGRIHLEGERTPPAPDAPRPDPVGLVLDGITQLRSSGRRGRGGMIDVLGDSIVLIDKTRLEATGRSGGSIRIGGDWQGGNGVRQATRVYASRDVVVDVSAEVGAGGTAVLWSDVSNPYSVTSAHGTILARGGGAAGAGGRVETSGNTLRISGIRVRANSPTGKTGLWLLDPGNITIDNVGPTDGGFSPPVPFDALGPSTIAVADIVLALDAGTPVMISTFGAGNISVNNSIATTSATPVMLSLNAEGTITFANLVTITTSGPALNLELRATDFSFSNNTVTLGGGTLAVSPPNSSPPGPTAFANPFAWDGVVGVNFVGNSPVGKTHLGGLTITNIANLGGIFLGHAANTSDIEINSPINLTSPATDVNIQGANITINAPITTQNLMAMTATGTIGGAGTVTTGGLLIDNAASVVGLNTAISASLAVNAAGGVSVTNTGNLFIGSIFATNGITAGGPINIATTTGNINVNQPVVTSDGSGNAIRLNAGQTAGAGGTGTPASGNIDITGAAVGGAIQAGAGGIISLFSGSIAGSANLITKVGGSGSGNFRYNSDEGFSGYTAPLSLSTGAPNTGLNAIFREQPSLSVTPSLHTIIYGDAIPAFTATFVGASNGDNAAATTTGVPAWTIGGATSTTARFTAGLHEVSYASGLTSSLGYAVINNAGSINELTISKKVITSTGITANNKVYDGTQAATLLTGGALIAGGATTSADNLFYTGDTVTLNVAGAVGTLNTKNAGVTKPVVVTGLTLGGADGGNYDILDASGATANVTAKTLNQSGLTSANKVYDGLLTATVGGTATLGVAQAPGTGSAVDGNPYTGDAVNLVGAVTGSFNSKDVLAATTVSFGGLTLGGAEAGNYLLNPHPTAAHTIAPAPLAVTALGMTKIADGLPHTGGNGVSFAGFVAGETSAVLGGILSYAGTSQGATAPGNYVITPQGLTSSNYAISFVGGALSITAAAPTTTTATSTTPVVLVPTPVQIMVPPLSMFPPPPTELSGTSINQVPTTSTGVSSDGAGTSSSTSTSTSSTGGTESGGDTPSGSTSSTSDTSGSTSTSTSSTSGTASSDDTASASSSTTSTDGTSTASSSPASSTTTAGSTTATAPAPGATSTGTVAQTTPPATTTGPAGPVVAGGTIGSIQPPRSAIATQSTPPARAGSVTPPGGAARIVETAGAGPAVDPAAAKVTPATVIATATRLASTDAPASSIDALVTARVAGAVGGGTSAATAIRAGNAFSSALAQKLAQGQPMAQAMASAERAFQAESSVPPPRTPAVALSRAIAAGGGDVATSLNSVATTKTSAGSAAFDRSLSSALARGLPMDAAVSVAKEAVRQTEQIATADMSPRAQLASGSAASGSPQSANPAYQKSLSSLLAQGVSPQNAMARAGQAAEADAAAARADARNPSAGLASGRAEAIVSGTGGGASEQVLALALARGEEPGVAMARAAEIQRLDQAAIAADARQPQGSLVRSGTTLPDRGVDFDRALANALGRGLPPQDALQVANRAADAVAPAPTLESALATGVGVEKLVAAPGSSRTFRAALSAALARGAPPARAIEAARRAEDANAFRFTVPSNVARSLPRNLNDAKVTDADGRPLPSWLRFDPAKRQFIATDVPEGGLPIQAVVVAGQSRVPILISDGPMPK